MCAVVRETLSHKAVVPYDRERVRKATQQVIDVLARGNRARKLTDECLWDLRTVGEQLYLALIPQAVRDDLNDLEESSLLLEIDQELVFIPWELLFDGKKFFCRRYNLGRAVSTSQAPLAPSAKSMSLPARMLILCSDPRGDLPSVGQEGQAVTKTLDNHPALNVRLTGEKPVEFVRRALKDYDIVHFAGHADYNADQPHASGWHLSDGKLTAQDIMSLAGGRPMPLVVFSNACQSSHSQPEDETPEKVFGLANAFLLSGVRYYIGTQWDVVDIHSQGFAKRFYSELAKGRSVGSALRQARQSIVVSEGEGALSWATYVLYGDPGFVPLVEDQELSGPIRLPTPADIGSRESLKAAARHGSPQRLGLKMLSGPIIDSKDIAQNDSSTTNTGGKAILWILLAAVVTVVLAILASTYL